MSISEGRVDLYGTSITLHGSLNVLHFLKGIPHVAIGIRKRGMDPKWQRIISDSTLLLLYHLPNSFLIMEKCIL